MRGCFAPCDCRLTTEQLHRSHHSQEEEEEHVTGQSISGIGQQQAWGNTQHTTLLSAPAQAELCVLGSKVSRTHSFWRASRRWRAGRTQSRMTLKSTVTGRSPTVARRGIKAILHTSAAFGCICFVLGGEKDTTLDVPPASAKQSLLMLHTPSSSSASS